MEVREIGSRMILTVAGSPGARIVLADGSNRRTATPVSP
jgi:hypothetical protein